MSERTEQLIRVGHSPDADDAFMFYALARAKIDTGNLRFRHELVDIETLNRRALSGELELTAVSLHAYAYVADTYALCSCGASMGDGYGPLLVTRRPCPLGELSRGSIAIPGTLTTAYLALRLCLGGDFRPIAAPFDQILDATVRGEWRGERVDAGLIIHEGQLTYQEHQLHAAVDLGKWWQEETGSPLPLGANAVRKDLGPQRMREIDRLLKASIRYGLDHRAEALEYALGFGRGLDRSRAEAFVGMYVNDWTLDFGPRGRDAVQQLLTRGYEAGIIPQRVAPEFVA